MSRTSLGRMDNSSPPAKLRGYGQLVGSETKCLTRDILGYTFHFEQHSTGLDHRNPDLGRPLAFTHPGLGRFFGQRLVRENSHPHASATLDMARQRDSSRFDLAGRDPTSSRRLQSVVAKRKPGPAV